jgi:serine/threonine protein phosphatase PrpC
MSHFEVAFATDIGLKRSQNQDSGIALPEFGFFLVADGMGGHRGGEIASSMTVEIVGDFIKQSIAQSSQRAESGFNPRHLLNESLQRANYAIYDRSLKEPSLQGMGTTATALLFKDQLLTVGHVGDSRAYLLRDGAYWQLTRDHSLVQEKLRAGLITREQAKTDQMRNVITRSVGFGHETVVELYEVQVQEGDVLLLCSDGLSGQVEDQLTRDILLKEIPLQERVQSLVEQANLNGGFDNTTVIVVKFRG